MHGHDDEVTQELVAKYQRELNDLHRRQRALNELHQRVKDNPGTPATIHHKCARCDMVLDVPESSLIPSTYLDAALAAHQERCFRVGDHVRWEPHAGGVWVEGSIVHVMDIGAGLKPERMGNNAEFCGWRIGVPGGCATASIRRIPRPEQKDALDKLRHVVDQLVEVGVIAEEKPPSIEHATQCTYFDSVDAPCTCSSKYDGVSLVDLLAADLAMSRETLISDMPLWFRIQDGLTRTQRAAVSAYRSAELRKRIVASREAERCAVRVDLQDDEENPWR